MKSPLEIKTDKINIFKEHAEESKAIILANYKGLTVAQMEDLRIKLREAGGKISVIKNTLAKVALNDMGILALDEDLVPSLGEDLHARGRKSHAVVEGTGFLRNGYIH